MNVETDIRIEIAFGNKLLAEGMVTKILLQELYQGKIPLIEHFTSSGQLDSDIYFKLFSSSANIQYCSREDLSSDPTLSSKISIKFAEHYHFCPISLSENSLKIAVTYPLNIKTLDEIHIQLGLDIEQVLVQPDHLIALLKTCYGMSANIVDQIFLKDSSLTYAKDINELEITAIPTADKMPGNASVINLVNEIILEASQNRATDIHIEPYRGHFRLRYRIDGILHDAKLSEKADSLILPIISRIKIMSNLDIVEHRMPQDGRAIVQILDKRLDLRISCIPTPAGESVVIRVLKAEMTHNLAELGLSAHNHALLNKLLLAPNGMILLTGPTGSGKTTTLYACLNKIKSDQRKIISIEDPIEYEIHGISQIQVHEKAGLTFAKGLRSILRHDPDTLMVGEIRDLETAEIAIRAALTGHLIFSTLHTNDSCSGVTRLIEIGVEPFLVASSVNAIIAQRLIRKICPSCKVKSDEDVSVVLERLKEEKAFDKSQIMCQPYRGKGCKTCLDTGYFGRTAIHEIFVVKDDVKEMILKGVSFQDLRKNATRSGMKSLLHDGWEKIVSGETSLSEVLAVCNWGTD